MGKWAEKLKQEVDQKLENVRVQELRFFRIDEFKRNIKRVDEFAPTCADCKRYQTAIIAAVNTIDEAVKNPGRKRREYDRLIGRLSKHIQKEHGFYPPYYFSYLFALFGLLAGVFLGYILTFLNTDHRIEMFSIGISIGLIVAYIFGNIKDRKIRSEKKLM